MLQDAYAIRCSPKGTSHRDIGAMLERCAKKIYRVKSRKVEAQLLLV